MGTKFGLIVGAGVGYVLGTRAGRERYETLKTKAAEFRQSPLVAERMDQVAENLSEALRKGGMAATDKVVGIVKERMFGEPQDQYVDVTVVEVDETNIPRAQ
ncbi:MAG: YtxH domain-containing protein [Actinomycetaceae bacterium]|nr:YtxH domain-containing protein [Actinomycetaceae bacterium]